MDNSMTEGIIPRSFADAKPFILSVKFLMIETAGTALVGLVFKNIWLGACFFFGLIVFIWLLALLRAPFAQRNEARRQLSLLTHVDPDFEWQGIEWAARSFHDLLRRNDLWGAVRFFDETVERSTSPLPVVAAFRPWLQDGINRGIIKARAVPVNGSETIDIQPPLADDVLDYALDDPDPDRLTLGNDTKVTDVRIKTSSLAAYVSDLKN